MFTTNVYRVIYTLSARSYTVQSSSISNNTQFPAVRAVACIIRTHLVEHLVYTVDVSCSAVDLERETRSLLFSSFNHG